MVEEPLSAAQGILLAVVLGALVWAVVLWAVFA